MPSPLLTWILDLFYPPKCVLCGKLLPSGKELLCTKCKALPDQSKTIRKEGLRIRECVCALPYREPYRSSLLRFKFGGCSYYAEVYGPMVAKAIRERMTEEIDLISYIPLSRRRMRIRGYNQAQLIAEAVGRELNISVLCTLEKVRNVAPQSLQKGTEARKKNIHGVYRAINQEVFKGKRILLVDDIFTTGSTMSEAAGELRDNGAKAVYGAAVASGD